MHILSYGGERTRQNVWPGGWALILRDIVRIEEHVHLYSLSQTVQCICSFCHSVSKAIHTHTTFNLYSKKIITSWSSKYFTLYHNTMQLYLLYILTLYQLRHIISFLSNYILSPHNYCLLMRGASCIVEQKRGNTVSSVFCTLFKFLALDRVDHCGVFLTANVTHRCA